MSDRTFALLLAGAGVAWFIFFDWWLRNRAFLHDQGTQDLSLLASGGCLVFLLVAVAILGLPLLHRGFIVVPVAAWLTFAAVYLARRRW